MKHIKPLDEEKKGMRIGGGDWHIRDISNFLKVVEEMQKKAINDELGDQKNLDIKISLVYEHNGEDIRQCQPLVLSFNADTSESLISLLKNEIKMEKELLDPKP